MSYSVAVEYHNGTKRSMLLASEGTYTRFWETPAQALSLRLILSVVDTLFIVEREQPEKFRDEMYLLRAHHLDQNRDHDDSDIERLERLIGVFDEAIARWESVELIFVS